MLELDELIDRIEATVKSHALGAPGAYTRWTRAVPAQGRRVELDPYGVADAANILYTVGRFPSDPAEREAWVRTLQGLQDPGTGLFRETSHHPIHTTAHCIAALELFDARPLHPVRALLPLADPPRAEAFLDGLDWKGDPWSQSHQGAGLYAALVLTGEVGPAWEERYFAWLWERADPATGFFRKGCVPGPGEDRSRLFHHLAGTFHYFFNMDYARRPMRYPEAVVDTCLAIRSESLFTLCNWVGFAEIDWIYCLNRAVRQSGHRRREALGAMETLAREFAAYLMNLEWETDGAWDDLHGLFGSLCGLAELQQALPGFIRTARPLKLVLDRRPFI